jgi:hypothetical protein
MTNNTTEVDLTQAAMRYLKHHYNEDTVSMNILENDVQDGNGVLHVDCTVSVGGSRSDWTKWFTFEHGEVTDLRAKMR